MYVLRCLVDEDIPLNQGVLAPVEIRLPECLLNPPAHDARPSARPWPAAMSKRRSGVVDVLLGALGLAAASQGTMNNLHLRQRDVRLLRNDLRRRRRHARRRPGPTPCTRT